MMRFSADRVHAYGQIPELSIDVIAAALDWRKHPKDSLHQDRVGFSLAKHPDGAVRVQLWNDGGGAVWIIRDADQPGPMRKPNYSTATATTHAKVWTKRHGAHKKVEKQEHQTGEAHA